MPASPTGTPYNGPDYYAATYFAPSYYGAIATPESPTPAPSEPAGSTGVSLGQPPIPQPAVYYNPLPIQPSLFCCDEDVARMCTGDYHLLCPAGQVVASGADGFFDAGDLWTLGTSVDLEGQGLNVGHVVRLTAGTPATGSGTVYKGNGALFAVTAVGPLGATLRQLGQPAAFGQPPSPPGGLTAAGFEVLTLAPQILDASMAVKAEYMVDDTSGVRAAALIYDPQRVLQRYTALIVLQGQYATMNRTDRGDFPQKLKNVESQLVKAKNALVLKWGMLGVQEKVDSVWGTQIRR